MYSLLIHLNKRYLYLLEQHIESFESLSEIIRINTEGKSLIMKVGRSILQPERTVYMWKKCWPKIRSYSGLSYNVYYSCSSKHTRTNSS